MKKILLLMLLSLSMSSLSFADDFGHEGVNEEDPSLESMLQYALEDEVLAYTTYEEIIKAFDVSRPFSNIMKAELTHINMVKDLMKVYNINMPQVDPSDYILLPENLDAAYQAGVQAEIDNIALYKNFLEDKEVPEDVRTVFEYLIAGSEKHLSAFERQVDKTANTNSKNFRSKAKRFNR